MRAPDPLLAGLVVGAALLLGCARSDAGLREAPDFTLPRLTGGDSLSLAADFEDRWVLINFWASWCGPCRDEMPELIRLHRRYRSTELAILGVTVQDRPEDSRSFAREYGLKFPNVIGDDELYEAYELSPWIPVTLLVSPERRVVKQWLGPQTETIFVEGIRAAAPELEESPAAGLPANSSAPEPRSS